MKKLEENDVKKYFEKAIGVAKKSTCKRSKCGAIIVQNEEIIGEGYNSPPLELENQRRCFNSKKDYDLKITDKTCCVHAEERAIFDALKNNPLKIKNSKLYFVRLDLNNKILFAGKPYCTICSKIALDVGIKEFILFHEEGIFSYETSEYNNLSFEYK